MKVIVFVSDIFKKYPKLLIVNIILVVMTSVTEICSLVTVGPLIDFLTKPGLQGVSVLTKKVMAAMDFISLPLTLKGYLVIFVLFVFLNSSFRILVQHSIFRTKYAVMRGFMMGTFEEFFQAKWYFFSSGKQGTLLNTFMREFNTIGDAFGSMALFFAVILQLFFCLAVPFYISWQVTLVSLITALLFAWPFILFGKISYSWGLLNTSTGNRIGEIVHESLGLAKIILGFGNQEKSRESLELAFNNHCSATIKSQTLGIAIPTLYEPFGAVVLIVALFSSRIFGVSLSEMAVLFLALLKAVFSIGKLASYKHALDNFFPSYEQMRSLRSRAKQLAQPSGDRMFTGFDKGIKIECLTFIYSPHEPVLIDVNMVIPKGKMIAIVGESGAGKSTLIDMLMGFHEPFQGRVALDGVDLWEFDINSYRKRIGYVPQDTVLFNMSIKDNLFWAKDDASEREIKYACHMANADEFIEKFPKGYETLVGDRGVCLSGGQRQRIALARAILRQPAILFLDEATSSLDTHSERLVQQAIENIAKKTTIVVIAHRLSTIVNADYVYVLKKGRVIEEGKYSELTKTEGYFNHMVKLQLLETV